jgi:hypothetical protein
VLDRRALDAYRQRLRSIDEDLAEAEGWSDAGRAEILHAERDALLDELSAATGLGGRARPVGSSHERARVAVTKAVTAAIARIATVDGPLATHLRAAIRTGTRCSYEPLPGHGPEWVLDP